MNYGNACFFDVACKAQPQQKIHTLNENLHFKFVDTSPKAQYDKIYDTKSVWYDKTSQYDNFISMTRKSSLRAVF